MKIYFYFLVVILPSFSVFADKPNIVFVEVDDLTAKFTSPFGADFAITPNLDRLAAEGIVFENGIAQGTACHPSRNSMMICNYPHNVRDYKTGQACLLNNQLKQLPNDTWAFPQALQKAGYYTAYIGKSHLHPFLGDAQELNLKPEYMTRTRAHEIEFGLDYVWQCMGRTITKRQAQGGQITQNAYLLYLDSIGKLDDFKRSSNNAPTPLDPETEYMDSYFTCLSIEWLSGYKKSQGDKPFFLWIAYTNPHGPDDQPPAFHNIIDPNDIPDPIVDKDKSYMPPSLVDNKRNVTKSALASQAGNISYMDSQVGRVMDALKANGQFDNTMFVFFSDHGFMHGDHGLYGKVTLYKEVLNAALLIAYPKRFPQGKRIKEPVELLDVVQTAMVLAGVDEKERSNGFGYSLLPLIEGDPKHFPREAAFSEQGPIAATALDWKYIEATEDNKLYQILFDLKNDPDETENVAQANPDVVKHFAALVKKFRNDEFDYSDRARRDAHGPASGGVAP